MFWSRWKKKIINIRADINEIENRKTIENNKTKNFFKNINKIDKP